VQFRGNGSVTAVRSAAARAHRPKRLEIGVNDARCQTLIPPRASGSLLKRAIVNFTAPDLDRLVRIAKRKLKKFRYRPHLISGCLAATGLTIEAW
jgi:hypothetical protein